MLFKNPWLLAGLVTVLVPIILHLIRRQSAKPYDWGAMRFLVETVATRRKRMEWEDFLLMVTRCMLLALLALALARPFVPPDTAVPWPIVLPMLLLGLAAFGGSFVLSAPRGRWLLRGLTSLLVLGSAFLIWQEKNLNLKRFQTSARRDVALVIDASTSMFLRKDGLSAFERAITEARDFVKQAPKGTAFSVILGGPAPELKTATPLTHRADVLKILDRLEPVGGPFRAYEALGVATLSLAEGRGSRRDLVVFSDGQRIGWQLDRSAAWSQLGEAWEGLPEGAQPRLLLRSLVPPECLRNVSLSGIELSREVVGTDREVTIQVRIENTGSEVVTPGLIRVNAGGEELEAKGLGQMKAGESALLNYPHRFTKAGPQVIKVTLEGNDDLAGDDLAERVIWVKKRLPVLIVEGNGGASFFQRAAGYVSLALAPLSGEEGNFVSPRVIDAAALTREKLDEEAVIILADVARLPASAAARIAEFVTQGGGLWVIAGPKVEPDFYQEWEGEEGRLLPFELGEMRLTDVGVRPAVGSFEHPALRLFQGKAGQDLGEALVEGYREIRNLSEGAAAAARYRNGEVFLAAREYGRGRVMVSTTAMDARLGSFPARPSFVPLVHELTNWLAGGQVIDLNLRASWIPTLPLPGGGGLSGKYRALEGAGQSARRIDPKIHFEWENGSPGLGMSADRFEVIWTGSLLPPLSGDYVFEVLVDDFFEMTLDGELVYESEGTGGVSRKIPLVAGKPLSFSARYQEEWGEAFVTLKWQRPDGVTELIPSSAFSAVTPEEGDFVLGEGSARDPRGRERGVELLLGRQGKRLEVEGSAIPGEYVVKIPQVIQGEFAGEQEVPLVVLREKEESRLEGWNEDDRNLIRREIDLIELDSMNDVLAALKGQGFGREIWKILALAALVLFFIEGLLARWVSKSRQAGEDVSVDFEKREEMPESFLEAVRSRQASTEMKGGGS